jgi:alkylation response protein AidB-like acyl-CoA dehydrogenase
MRQAGLELRRRSAELGFYAAHMPAEVGGWGLSSLPTLMELPPHVRDEVFPLWSAVSARCASR